MAGPIAKAISDLAGQSDPTAKPKLEQANENNDSIFDNSIGLVCKSVK